MTAKQDCLSDRLNASALLTLTSDCREVEAATHTISRTCCAYVEVITNGFTDTRWRRKNLTCSNRRVLVIHNAERGMMITQVLPEAILDARQVIRRISRFCAVDRAATWQVVVLPDEVRDRDVTRYAETMIS